MIDPAWVSGLSALLFVIGLAGAFTRKNAIIVLMCIELMLNAANMQFAAAAVHHGDTTGWVYTIFAIAIAASEVAIGLAIFACHVRPTRIDYAGRRERPEELGEMMAELGSTEIILKMRLRNMRLTFFCCQCWRSRSSFSHGKVVQRQQFLEKLIERGGLIALPVMGASLLLSLWLIADFIGAYGGVEELSDWTWFTSSMWTSGVVTTEINFGFGIHIDHITVMLLFIASFLCLLINTFAVGYMNTDPINDNRNHRFYAEFVCCFARVCSAWCWPTRSFGCSSSGN